MKANRTLWMLCALAELTTAAQAAEIAKTWIKAQVGAPTGLYLVIDLTPRRIAIGEQPDEFTPPETIEGYVVSNLAAVPPGGWTEEYKTTKLVLRRIPAGTFTIGSPTNELGRDSDETQHSVTLTKDFYIGVFEVTLKQWEMVMGEFVEGHWKMNASGGNDKREIHARPVEQVSYFQIRESLTTCVAVASAATGKPAAAEKKAAPPPKPPQKPKGIDTIMAGEDEPPPPSPEQEEAARKREADAKGAAAHEARILAAQPSHDPKVDWPANSVVNANSFMGRLRTRTRLAGLDLPTEAQWEYACRAGTATALGSAKDLTQTDECPNVAAVGRYMFNVDKSDGWFYTRQDRLGTAAAGSYAPNKWGLYDMHGNVWEWCLDWYAAAYPRTATDPKGPPSGMSHVLRGGSFDERAKACRSANRGAGGDPAARNGAFGFRVALTLP